MNCPWVPLPTALVLLRVGTAGLFLAHAIVRVINDTIPQFAAFLGRSGFPEPVAVVWLITAVELVCGVLVVVGYKPRYTALGLMAIAVGGIAVIHAKLGWFVGEHGTGGSEYSVSLILALLVIMAEDAKGASRWSDLLSSQSGNSVPP